MHTAPKGLGPLWYSRGEMFRRRRFLLVLSAMLASGVLRPAFAQRSEQPVARGEVLLLGAELASLDTYTSGDSASVLRYFVPSARELRRCYDRVLEQRPGLEGPSMATVRLSPDGLQPQSFDGVLAEDLRLRTCFQQALASVRVPSDQQPTQVRVLYRFLRLR